jgi:osmotically inducible protein OsmC
MKPFGSAAWDGGMREGKGSVSTESRALETYPYTFLSRYGEKPGTNPEELLGAAHAACFTMSFVRLLGMANFVPEQVDSKSEVVIDKDGDGFSITSVHLTVTAKIPGIDQAAFQSIAAKIEIPMLAALSPPPPGPRLRAWVGRGGGRANFRYGLTS